MAFFLLSAFLLRLFFWSWSAQKVGKRARISHLFPHSDPNLGRIFLVCRSEREPETDYLLRLALQVFFRFCSDDAAKLKPIFILNQLSTDYNLHYRISS